MAILDEIYSWMLASKNGAEVPTALTIGSSEWIVFWHAANKRFEKIEKSKLAGNVFSAPNFLGTVTTAGVTTTETEIKDFINATGFTIVDNEFKILKLNVYINSVLYVKQYLFKANLTGIYGTGNTVIVFSDLFEIESKKFNYNTETTTIIALGNIAPETTIEDYINANNDPFWNLQSNTIYIFTATISAVVQTYLYVGTQPLLLGLNNNAVTAADFLRVDGFADLMFFGNQFQSHIKYPGNVNAGIQVNDSVLNGYEDGNKFIKHMIFTNTVGDGDYNNTGNWNIIESI
jgi:hypothetical protein